MRTNVYAVAQTKRGTHPALTLERLECDEAVRTAPDPDAALLEFLQTTYEAAADNGDWDRRALEDDPRRRARPR